jgi:flagellar capping protein FliD
MSGIEKRLTSDENQMLKLAAEINTVKSDVKRDQSEVYNQLADMCRHINQLQSRLDELEKKRNET